MEKIGLIFERTTAGKGFFLERNENENLNALSHPGSSGNTLKKPKPKQKRANLKQLFLFEMLSFALFPP